MRANTRRPSLLTQGLARQMHRSRTPRWCWRLAWSLWLLGGVALGWVAAPWMGW